jgi:hypothetical protein
MLYNLNFGEMIAFIIYIAFSVLLLTYCCVYCTNDVLYAAIFTVNLLFCTCFAVSFTHITRLIVLISFDDIIYFSNNSRTDLNEECSDHEEEFYYTEIEIDDNSFGSSGSNSSVSPAPQSPSASNDGSTMSGSQSPIPNKFFPSSSAPTFSIFKDHEYEKRSDNCDLEMNALNVNNNTNNKLSNNSNSVINNNIKGKQKSLLSNPINIPLNGISSSHTHQYATSAPPVSLQSPRANYKYMRLNSNNKSGTTLLQSPNKNSPSKRGRGESRKCRKVYGMDNRDSWCTQCKWKKACSRFTD